MNVTRQICYLKNVNYWIGKIWPEIWVKKAQWIAKTSKALLQSLMWWIIIHRYKLVRISDEIREKKKGCCSNQEQMYLEAARAAHQLASKERPGINFRVAGQIRNKSKTKKPWLNAWFQKKEIWSCLLKKRENVRKKPFRRRILAKSCWVQWVLGSFYWMIIEK